MNNTQKIAFVVLQVEAILYIFEGLREFVAVTVYVATTHLGILPPFYLNIGYTIFFGFLYLVTGLVIYALSRPIAAFIGANKLINGNSNE